MDQQPDGAVRSALATLAAPPTPATFWTELHHELMQEAEREPAPSTDVSFGNRPGGRRHPAVAALTTAAVIALVVSGLVWIARRDRLQPAGPTPPASVATRPIRPNATIADPHAIDLDPWLVGSLQRDRPYFGPYDVFDVTKLPSGWTVRSVIGGQRIPNYTGVQLWIWRVRLTSSSGVSYQLTVHEEDGTLPLGGETDRVRVRGLDGYADDGQLEWRESNGLFVSIAADSDGDHRQQELDLANSLVPVSRAELPGDSTTFDPSASVDETLPAFRGIISGHPWSVEMQSSPDVEMRVFVDGQEKNTMLSPGLGTPSAPALALDATGVDGGVILFGLAPSSVKNVVVELSDTVRITLPVTRWQDGSAFAAPIPNLLDVANIAFVDASGIVLHLVNLPRFVSPIVGGCQCNMPFGQPNGVALERGGGPAIGVSTATTSVVTAPVSEPTPTTDPAETALRARPLTLPPMVDGACPVTTFFTSPSTDLGPMAGDGVARPVGLRQSGATLIGSEDVGKSTEWGGLKTVWAIDANTAGPVLIRGRQIDGDAEVRFGEAAVPTSDLVLLVPDEATHQTGTAGLDPMAGGWFGLLSSIRLKADGCYGLQIDSAAGTSTVVFQAAFVARADSETTSTTH